MAARELTPEETALGMQHINAEDLTATQLQALVRNMDVQKRRFASFKENKRLYEDKLRESNTVLYYNYPSLFQMHAEDRLDVTFFEMLTLKRKIEKGEITPEQGTTIIGQKLAERYISAATAPAAGPAPSPTMSYEEYYRQVQNNTP